MLKATLRKSIGSIDGIAVCWKRSRGKDDNNSINNSKGQDIVGRSNSKRKDVCVFRSYKTSDNRQVVLIKQKIKES